MNNVEYHRGAPPKMDVMVAALSRLEALERREAATGATVARLVQSVQRLEQQNRQLELRNARLSRTVSALQTLAGNAVDILPESEPLPVPSLSDLPHEVLVCVCSFLGIPDLRRLALVARRFTTSDEGCVAKVAPSGGDGGAAGQANYSHTVEPGLSIIMAGARSRALRQAANLVVHPPRDEGQTWLQVLRRLESPRFDDPRGEGRISDGGVTAYNAGGDDYGEVLCNELQMLAGAHYCEFTVEWQDHLEDSAADALVPEVDFGVVGPGYDPPAEDSSAVWLFSAINGGLFHDGNFADWPGQPGRGEIGHGDAVGLLVDLTEGTIVAFHRRRKSGHLHRLGVMMQPGQKNMDGQLVKPLCPPLRWAVSLEHGALVRLLAGQTAPSVSHRVRNKSVGRDGADDY